MKRLFCLFLIILFCFASKAQTIGVLGNINATGYNLDGDKYTITDGLNGGIFYSAPIYKRLEYLVGLNLVNISGINKSYYSFIEPAPYNNRKSKTGILEVPIELAVGLYRKNSDAKCKGYLHAGYTIGTNIYNQFTYTDWEGNVTDRQTNGSLFGNTLYHSIRVELEIRWQLPKSNTISLFMCQRSLGFRPDKQDYNEWYNYFGVGFRLGLKLKNPTRHCTHLPDSPAK